MKNRRTAAKSLMVEPTQTLKEIDVEIAKLKERAATIVAHEKAGVIDRIKEAISYYSITAGELGFGGARPSPRRVKSAGVAPSGQAPAEGAEVSSSKAPAKKPRAGAGGIKFKDDAGNAWSGFGPKPRWFTEALASGKTPEELKV
ncbi:H-NS family nucleoid-associated regulatory protein [Pseudorhodoferax soli]|uniref:H-NS histone family protein n=1 Tax=Pseudorhodoferax soli TaxID=545864 RepID=UPI001FE93B7B|nr:H-NS histone family protein [Pseudorhodoferax soli]